MRILVAAFAALSLLSQNAHAAEKLLEQETAKALAAGEPAAVVKALEKKVDAGNVVAALELGLIYRDGKGVAQDYAKARRFLKIAATPAEIRLWYKYGVAEAQCALAVMLRDGIGGKANASAAVPWFESAAQQGRLPAQQALPQMYFNGTGIKRDPERAFMWSSIAAASASGAAQKEMEQIRDLAQKQLEPKQLARAGNLVKNWKPKTG
ncbi:MAG: sel1 repeat family protein [Betaproteobacteria bacterium]|nr:MAG: hypothetical protein AMJ67_12145 [Betaproteobacteria bacterium SG8_41]UCF75563.1 MAG: sel1 repeat family protein [Betaproteobacteria bacterium]